MKIKKYERKNPVHLYVYTFEDTTESLEELMELLKDQEPKVHSSPFGVSFIDAWEKERVFVHPGDLLSYQSGLESRVSKTTLGKIGVGWVESVE